MPPNIKVRYSAVKGSHVSSIRKNKGKCKEGEDDLDSEKAKVNCLATLDIFAGCGGLSEGLQQSGILHLPLYICTYSCKNASCKVYPIA